MAEVVQSHSEAVLATSFTVVFCGDSTTREDGSAYSQVRVCGQLKGEAEGAHQLQEQIQDLMQGWLSVLQDCQDGPASLRGCTLDSETCVEGTGDAGAGCLHGRVSRACATLAPPPPPPMAACMSGRTGKRGDASSQSYANTLAALSCALPHATPPSTDPFGKNLYMSVSSSGALLDLNLAPSSEAWYSEVSNYVFSSQPLTDTLAATSGTTRQWGHSTQVVWKASTLLGCGRSATARPLPPSPAPPSILPRPPSPRPPAPAPVPLPAGSACSTAAAALSGVNGFRSAHGGAPALVRDSALEADSRRTQAPKHAFTATPWASNDSSCWGFTVVRGAKGGGREVEVVRKAAARVGCGVAVAPLGSGGCKVGR
ncbi:hypothetical protein HYH03_011292 [Edaphochlamys debaryana]|uniref:SCP domain-containing protein n=1 Tax=Edaphochlamys debaryana TaxID=47281 RepID=A0A836BVD9_9CHLO|nr:hypothetical protein HYH03_011292 [Edaphochlamys debaryana]|eukprot:KAG2490345.1 hypothetical protein HYH03_011292 [Edaphochlamys debaryana]